MDSAKLNEWMQVIGIFALVASLVFVGLQIKQTHEIALSESYQSRAATVIEMVTANAANESGYEEHDEAVVCATRLEIGLAIFAIHVILGVK